MAIFFNLLGQLILLNKIFNFILIDTAFLVTFLDSVIA